MTKYEDLTFEDKQTALDEAWEIMNPKETNAERLEIISKEFHSTGNIFAYDINWLIEQAERTQEWELVAIDRYRSWEKVTKENLALRDAIMMSLELHKWNNNESAAILEKALEDNP